MNLNSFNLVCNTVDMFVRSKVFGADENAS